MDLPEIAAGEIGFITAQIKEVEQARVGDTITTVKAGATQPLPGYKEVQPVVFCGLFPVDAADFEKLRESIAKLRLNDASLPLRADVVGADLALDLEVFRSSSSSLATLRAYSWRNDRVVSTGRA